MRPRTRQTFLTSTAVCLGLTMLLGACRAGEGPRSEANLEQAAATVPADAPSASSEVEIVEGDLPREGANADVLRVRALQEGETLWRFEVTIQHPDTGAKDRVDGWDLLLPDDSVVKPVPGSAFTQAIDGEISTQPEVHVQTGIVIPVDTELLRVRAHDSVDGFGGRELLIDMRTGAGPGYEIVHTY